MRSAKLPRLADVKFTDGSGKQRRRYGVRRNGRKAPHCFIWDKQRDRFFLTHREHERDYFFSTKAARNWLQKTTVKWHRTRAVEEALDDVA
jgi:hypothetical protein